MFQVQEVFQFQVQEDEHRPELLQTAAIKNTTTPSSSSYLKGSPLLYLLNDLVFVERGSDTQEQSKEMFQLRRYALELHLTGTAPGKGEALRIPNPPSRTTRLPAEEVAGFWVSGVLRKVGGSAI